MSRLVVMVSSLMFLLSMVVIPAKKGVAMGGKTTIPQVDTYFNSAQVSPDGKYVIFSYKYKDLFYRLGLLNLEVTPSRFTSILFPPSQDWLYPTFSQDMKYMAASSYCEESPPYKCHEGVSGYHIWRLGLEDASFKRMTPTGNNIRRLHPVFGSNSNEIYYIISDPNEKSWPVTFIAKTDEQGIESTIFPERLGSKFLGKDLRLVNLQISNDIESDEHSMLATLGGGPDVLMNKMDSKDDKSGTYLLKKNNRTALFLEEDVVACYTVSKSADDIVYAKMDYGNMSDSSDSKVYSIKAGHKKQIFSFNGYIRQISISDDLVKVLFLGKLDGQEWDIWLYDRQQNALNCLNIRETIETELPILIQNDQIENEGQSNE